VVEKALEKAIEGILRLMKEVREEWVRMIREWRRNR
jgi:hypothetical protein